MSEAPSTLRESVLPEDQARADFYALLARLFADAPDAALLAAIAGAAPLVPVTPVEGQDTLINLRLSWRFKLDLKMRECWQLRYIQSREL